MDTDRLLELPEYWSFLDDQVPPTIPRDVVLPPRLSESLALVIQGVRRCGKSTLLAQMMKRYRLNPHRTPPPRPGGILRELPSGTGGPGPAEFEAGALAELSPGS